MLSHPFDQDPTEFIKKSNLNNFYIKYDVNNTNNYIIDTNKIDKFMYR